MKVTTAELALKCVICVDLQVDRSLAKAIDALKLCKEIATLTPQNSREINSWYQGMKEKTGKTLASLQVHCFTFSITCYFCITVS